MLVCSLLVLMLILAPSCAAASAPEPAPRQLAFDYDALVADAAAQGRVWSEFLAPPRLHVGIYRLAAGELDDQTPHADDEVYYVVRGVAGFTADGAEHAAHAGSIFFVAAEVPHRFHDVKEDLEVLVFFARTRPQTRT